MIKQTFINGTTLQCRTMLFSLCIIIFLSACSKDEDSEGNSGSNSSKSPTVTLVSCTKDTKFVASIVYKAIIKISDEGGTKVTQKGVKYGTTTECSYTSTTITNSDNAPQYTIAMVSLRPNQKYYVKAFATNENGTGYSSNVISFTTK